MHRLDKLIKLMLDRWIFCGLLGLLGVFSLIHPELVLLRESPMSGDPWTIKDPTVSWMAFMPSLREFRFELFEHGNILWSNLRALGQPMLGNGVQGAPLFPLTLALIWLPDSLFWSVMPITRVVLIALACFVLARKVFGQSLLASFCFALLAGFNLNVFRWINHPWSNGMLAGLWYLFFLHQVCFADLKSRGLQRGAYLGLIVSIYAMVTCGFPEAAAAMALLVLVLFCALTYLHRARLAGRWRSILHDLLICHIAGFGFSAIQLFALLEYIEFTRTMMLRENYIGATFRADEARSYWLSQFSLLGKSDLQHRYLNFSIGMTGFFLACKGIIAWLFVPSRVSNTSRAVGLGFLLLMALFVAKSFALLDWLEWLFAHTPVLAQSHFPLYFSPLFYFGVAFFAAHGVRSITDSINWRPWQRILDLVVSILAILVAARLLAAGAEHFNNIAVDDFWIRQRRGDGAGFIWAFFAVAGLLTAMQALQALAPMRQFLHRHAHGSAAVIAVLVLGSLVLEAIGTTHSRFANRDSSSLFLPAGLPDVVQQAVEKSSFARHELRNNDRAGSFVGLGIASIDNGISAMLPPNLRRVRNALFQTQYGGYYPLGAERYPGAGMTLGNNLHIAPVTPDFDKDWQSYRQSPQLKLSQLEWDREIQLMRDEPWIMHGSLNSSADPAAVEVWVQFDDGRQSRWMQAEVSAGKHGKMTAATHSRRSTRWKLRIPSIWLEDTRYEFVVRVSERDSKLYQDSERQSLVIHKPYPFAQPSRATSRAAALNSVSLGATLQQDWQVLLYPDALPRAYVASACQLYPDENSASEFFSRASVLQSGMVALVASDPAISAQLPDDFCDAYSATFSRVKIQQDRGSKVRLAPVRGPALVYLADSYYPGWQVSDKYSRSELSIVPANLGMRAVYLPEDRDYLLDFRYRPGWLNLVWLMLLVALLTSIYLIVRVEEK